MVCGLYQYWLWSAFSGVLRQNRVSRALERSARGASVQRAVGLTPQGLAAARTAAETRSAWAQARVRRQPLPRRPLQRPPSSWQGAGAGAGSAARLLPRYPAAAEAVLTPGPSSMSVRHQRLRTGRGEAQCASRCRSAPPRHVSGYTLPLLPPHASPVRRMRAPQALLLLLVACALPRGTDGGMRRLSAVAADNAAASNATGVPRCALVVHFHVPRAAGTFVRALMANSAEGGDWEFVQPPAFRSSWPPLGGAVLGGTAADCSAEWTRRHGARGCARTPGLLLTRPWAGAGACCSRCTRRATTACSWTTCSRPRTSCGGATRTAAARLRSPRCCGAWASRAALCARCHAWVRA